MTISIYYAYSIIIPSSHNVVGTSCDERTLLFCALEDSAQLVDIALTPYQPNSKPEKRYIGTVMLQ